MSIEKDTYIGNEEKSDLTKDILEKTGMESKPLNDYTQYHESEERGGVLINVDSKNMFEEDLSQMEKSKTILGEETHKRLVTEAFKDTIKTLGDYIPVVKIERIFPGIDLANLDSYDFSLAKAKVFILSNEDYLFLRDNLYSEKDKKGTTGFTTPTVESRPVSIVNTAFHVDISEKKIIVIRESSQSSNESIEKTVVKDPSEITDKEKNLLALNIKATLVHELLHGLDISTDLPLPLNEGITEWYAQQVVNGKVEAEDFFKDKGIYVGYKRETEGLSILVSAMLEDGIKETTLDKAFLSNDAGARKQIELCLVGRYGTEATSKILEWDFKSPIKALEYIVELESSQDSNIGNFLKTFKQ